MGKSAIKRLFAACAFLLMHQGAIASDMPNIKASFFIRLEYGVSKKFIQNVQHRAKQNNISIIINPKLTCLDAGFNKSDLFSEGTMYGSNRPDGSLEIGGKGDFKAYTFTRYTKGTRECREKHYTRQYDPERFGSQSYAVIMMP